MKTHNAMQYIQMIYFSITTLNCTQVLPEVSFLTNLLQLAIYVKIN